MLFKYKKVHAKLAKIFAKIAKPERKYFFCDLSVQPRLA
jgi:hypothetical protein